MENYLIGIDHQSADLALRAQYHLTAKQILEVYDSGRVPPETVILATCNRTEFYFHWDGELSGLQDCLRGIYPERSVDWTSFYQRQGDAVILHLLRLAVGLQSMITGETEILGQLGAAFQLALSAGITSQFGYWRRLFGKIAEYARYIRKKSKIGAYNLSLASLVVKEVKQYFGGNQEQPNTEIPPRALILGNGAIAQKLSRVFTFQGIPVSIASRNSEAQRERFGEVQRYDWDYLGQALVEADFIVAATTAPHFLLKREHFEQLNGKLLIDLAFPRNIDPEVAAAVECELWDLAYFGEKSAANQAMKRRAIEKAECLCLHAVERFQAKYPVESQRLKVKSPKSKVECQ